MARAVGRSEPLPEGQPEATKRNDPAPPAGGNNGAGMRGDRPGWPTLWQTKCAVERSETEDQNKTGRAGCRPASPGKVSCREHVSGALPGLPGQSGASRDSLHGMPPGQDGRWLGQDGQWVPRSTELQFSRDQEDEVSTALKRTESRTLPQVQLTIIHPN